jgi:hypothetical protein
MTWETSGDVAAEKQAKAPLDGSTLVTFGSHTKVVTPKVFIGKGHFSTGALCASHLDCFKCLHTFSTLCQQPLTQAQRYIRPSVAPSSPWLYAKQSVWLEDLPHLKPYVTGPLSVAWKEYCNHPEQPGLNIAGLQP